MKSIFEKHIKMPEQKFIEFPWHDKNAYASWLAQTYYYVCHSTRLLCLAAARFGQSQAALHRRFIAHTKEESAHEILAMNDLKFLGFDIKKMPEFPEVQAFYQTQYYQIEHVDPISFFGYILCLEGLAVRQGGNAAKKVISIHGEKAASFLNLHSEEDPGHLDTAFKNLQSITSKEAQIIEYNLELSCSLYTRMLQKAESAVGIIGVTQKFKKTA